MPAHPVLALIAALFAFCLGQGPEFLQQYAQRLGGAADEVADIVQRFDEDSRRSGYSRAEALQVMRRNQERLVRDQATRMEESTARLNRLRQQQEAFNGGLLERAVSFLGRFDSPLAGKTWETYRFAIPVSKEGLLICVGGYLAFYYLLVSVVGLFRPRRYARIN